MPQVAIFWIIFVIIAISALFTLIVFRSASKKSTSESPKETLVPRLEIDPMEIRALETAIEFPLTIAQSWSSSRFWKLFKPEENGIFHKLENITDKGRDDLEFTIESLRQPQVATSQILECLRDPSNVSIDLNVLSDRNPDLVQRIVSLINAPYNGIDREITSLNDAANRLGYDELRIHILAASLFKRASGFHGPLSIDALWIHSLAMTRIISWLKNRVGVEIRDGLAGTSAIYHDIGKIVIQKWRPERYRMAVRKSRIENIPLYEAELSDLGITNSFAAELLMSAWHLPESLRWIVKKSQLGDVSGDFPEKALISLAGQIARYMDMGADGEPAVTQIDYDIRDSLNIEETTVAELIEKGFRDFATGTLSILQAAEINYPA